MTLNTLPYQLVCEGCGVIGRYRDAEAAFLDGWDGPPHFTVVVCCPRCSAAEILIERNRKHRLPRPLTLPELAQAMIMAGHASGTVTNQPDP